MFRRSRSYEESAAQVRPSRRLENVRQSALLTERGKDLAFVEAEKSFLIRSDLCDVHLVVSRVAVAVDRVDVLVGVGSAGERGDHGRPGHGCDRLLEVRGGRQ